MARLLKKAALSDVQRDVYEFIVGFSSEYGRVPKLIEIVEGCKHRNEHTVKDAKRVLVGKGYIRITGHGKYEIEE